MVYQTKRWSLTGSLIPATQDIHMSEPELEGDRDPSGPKSRNTYKYPSCLKGSID